MTEFRDDIKLEKKFAETMAGILGKFFIKQDCHLDWHEATDFAVFDIQPFKVAARLRRYENAKGYPTFLKHRGEFTIRWSRPNNIETEIHKIRRGFCEYMLYGFLDKPEKNIIQYFIGDLNVFRDFEPEPYEIKTNTDSKQSQMAAYRLIDLPETFLLKEWPKKIVCRPPTAPEVPREKKWAPSLW